MTAEQKEIIFKAIEDGDQSSLKRLFEVEKVSLKITRSGKQTVAHAAAKKGDLEIFKYLVQKDVTLAKSADLYGSTPLLKAVEAGALDIVKYLIGEHKVSPTEHYKRRRGNTLIHIAAQAGRLEVLKFLVESEKVDVNVKNDLGETPAFSAAERAQLDVIKFLVEEAKANLTLTDKKNDNILFVSALQGDTTIPRYLLDEKKLSFDIDRRDRLGRTLVFLAAGLENLDFLKYIVGEKHADVNQCDSWGGTPLHQAATTGNMHVVQYLLEKGASPVAKDDDDKVPRELASNINLVKYLERIEKLHRVRRSTSLSQNHLRTQPLFEGSSNNLIVAQRTLSETWIEGHELAPFNHINNWSQIGNIFLLFSTWIKCTKKASPLRAICWSSLSSREILENRHLALEISAHELHKKLYNV